MAARPSARRAGKAALAMPAIIHPMSQPPTTHEADLASVGQSLREAAAQLPGDSPRVDAELLLMHALGRSRSWLFAHADDLLSSGQRSAFDALVRRRGAGEPVAHILGQREFWSLALVTTPDTLIPRADTERLVELALVHLPTGSPAAVLDLGTGTGAIALAIAIERPAARLIATDASEAALAVARGNIRRLAPGCIETRLGDWFGPVTGLRFDVVVSNPPYIAERDPHLDQGDLRFEPRDALASGPDGLNAIRRILADAPVHLVDGGWLLIEHGHEQGAAVRSLFENAGLTQVETARDLEHRERVTLGQWREGGV
jgi:release factor glutamine methyltransferase